jgi:hypothetical protein
MRNRDVCELFEQVGRGTRVDIFNTTYGEAC